MKYYLFLLGLILSGFVYSQGRNLNSHEIYEEIKKLNILGSVLYVAAHPDDENTRLITSLSKDHLLRTAYISLTRGDGGQNLIGPELDELLGVIRTNELIEARKIDGGIQYFSRANDFGYSKNAEETYRIWDPKIVQEDLVATIREFQPDVIINRFDHRTSGKTHGHHTASAVMALEAFQNQFNPTYYSQIKRAIDFIPAKKIFFNTSWFFWGSRENFEKADKRHLYSLDVGNYNPALGLSSTEVAAQSRSMHKSQGFGINTTRGKAPEYFERIDTNIFGGNKSPFDDLDFSWRRVKNGAEIITMIDSVIMNYDFKRAHLSIPVLQRIESKIEKLEASHWRNIKLKDIRHLISQCAAIYFSANTEAQISSIGNTLKINVEFIPRSLGNIQIKKLEFIPSIWDTTMNISLSENTVFNLQKNIIIPSSINISSPFWLWNGRGRGNYSVDDRSMVCLPIQPKELRCKIKYSLHGKEYEIEKEIYSKNDDPVLGEVSQGLDVLPSVVAIAYDPLVITSSASSANFTFKIKSIAKNQSGRISFKTSDDIKIVPSSIDYKLKNINEEQEIKITIQTKQSNNTIQEVHILNHDKPLFIHYPIRYPHIQFQNVLLPAKIKVSDIDLHIKKMNIAYVEGAGDYTPKALEKINLPTYKISRDELKSLSPKKYPVLIFGIRALNTREEYADCKQDLLNYMNQGGRVIMQYNTTAELKTDDFAPSPLKISRDRVTDENSVFSFPNPNHALLNKPNKINEADFKDWVQERGLYFPNTFDSTYTEIIHMNDPSEKPLRSAILYKKVGKGSFIYTPISWFRQLPAGVPGAYRLFNNLIQAP